MKAGIPAGIDDEDVPRPVSDVVCALGEGPTWDAEAGVVRWVDIDRGVLYEAPVGDRVGAGEAGPSRIGPTRIVLTVDGTLGAAVHAEGGGFLLATARRLEHRDASGAAVATWELIPPGQPRRLNDGACDPEGRYVVGSLRLGTDGRSADDGCYEQLWRLEHDGTVTVLDEGLALSNGIAWSPEGRVMYNVDTMMHRVYARAYGPEDGGVGPASVLIDTGAALPDGLTVDSLGDLWIAMWGEGTILRFAPDGTPRGALRTGVPHTTSCAFVGPALDLMVVTSAASDDALDGRLLAIDSSVRGLPTTAWRPCVDAVSR